MYSYARRCLSDLLQLVQTQAEFESSSTPKYNAADKHDIPPCHLYGHRIIRSYSRWTLTRVATGINFSVFDLTLTGLVKRMWIIVIRYFPTLSASLAVMKRLFLNKDMERNIFLYILIKSIREHFYTCFEKQKLSNIISFLKGPLYIGHHTHIVWYLLSY